jgi:hypothetical protein
LIANPCLGENSPQSSHRKRAIIASILTFSAAVQDALRERDAARLRLASHKLCGMVAAYSTVAGNVASDLEDLSAQGELDEACPLVGQLEMMVEKLMRVIGGLSLTLFVNRHSLKPNRMKRFDIPSY